MPEFDFEELDPEKVNESYRSQQARKKERKKRFVLRV